MPGIGRMTYPAPRSPVAELPSGRIPGAALPGAALPSGALQPLSTRLIRSFRWAISSASAVWPALARGDPGGLDHGRVGWTVAAWAEPGRLALAVEARGTVPLATEGLGRPPGDL